MRKRGRVQQKSKLKRNSLSTKSSDKSNQGSGAPVPSNPPPQPHPCAPIFDHVSPLWYQQAQTLFNSSHVSWPRWFENQSGETILDVHGTTKCVWYETGQATIHLWQLGHKGKQLHWTETTSDGAPQLEKNTLAQVFGHAREHSRRELHTYKRHEYTGTHFCATNIGVRVRVHGGLCCTPSKGNSMGPVFQSVRIKNVNVLCRL